MIILCLTAPQANFCITFKNVKKFCRFTENCLVLKKLVYVLKLYALELL